MFEPSSTPRDEEGFRTCGCCNTLKPVDEFYKDGKDGNGNPKYRRDCKECYRVTRLSSRKKKRYVPTKKGRGKK